MWLLDNLMGMKGICWILTNLTTTLFKPFYLINWNLVSLNRASENKSQLKISNFRIFINDGWEHAKLTWTLSANAESFAQGATHPGSKKLICSPSSGSSATYVILMSTSDWGGRLPTLTLNTSCRNPQQSLS